MEGTGERNNLSIFNNTCILKFSEKCQLYNNDSHDVLCYISKI